jgi:hypothetical protein
VSDSPIQIVEDIASLRPEYAPGAGPAPTVERALREVLGRSISPSDPAAFLSALERSFTRVRGLTPDTGRWDWTPRGSSLQVDLGALTGGQASLYRRAQRALEEAIPLIAGLEPMIPYDDEEAVAASREVVRSELQRIVEEIGSEGGPSVGLVNQLFEALVGAAPGTVPRPDAEHVGGHLGRMRESFGLNRQLVNTVAEEQNFTNFIVLADYVVELWSEWGSFVASDDVFFGTQLVLIARQLEVSTESIHEVDAALDAVLIGPGERQTLRVPVGDSDAYLGAVLEWADHFLAVDARELIDTAGKDGALSLVPTLRTLSEQIGAFADVAASGTLPAGFPTLFRNVVVESTLRSLSGSLDRLLELIGALGDAQPVFGFPLRPPAIAIQPYAADVRVARVAAQAVVVVAVSAVGLPTDATIAFRYGSERREATLQPAGPNHWLAVMPHADLDLVGPWTIVLTTTAAGDFPVGTYNVAETGGTSND